ncbi:hypothetical protein Phou_063580 [Phytohabitans houttuyneae]|uniref:Uncharacterized protein n=1 Tax=Phytohabitans houttuyneae TaxID=1076126 RepID=A0A6V8KIF0_9ACTN|nr:hypothetical protein Phou_063580 [Phytohabitans houttuyneae]
MPQISGIVGAVTATHLSGSRWRTGYRMVTATVCQPVAPSGKGAARSGVWVSPVASVARTRMVWPPAVAFQVCRHWTQVSTDGTGSSSHRVHGASSTCSSTAAMPRCCAHATPAIVTGPGSRVANGVGRSMREAVLTDAVAAHPRCTQ